MPFLGAALAPVLTSLIGGGASILGGALASGSKTSTSTTGVSPAYQGQQDSLLAMLQKMLADPSSGLAPQESADSSAINRSYATMPDTVTQMLASRGFGSSGKVGDAVYDTEGQRLGAQSQLYGQYAGLASQRQMTAAQMMQQILSGNRTTTSTTPNNAPASALLSTGNGLQNLTALQTLQTMINGGGSMPSGTPSASSPANSGGVDPSLLTSGSPTIDPTGAGWST